MEPGIKLSVRQLEVWHRQRLHYYLYASAKEDADPRTGQHPHKGNGYEKERGPIVVWECVFSVAQYFYIFGVAWLKEMEIKPVAHWVRKNWEDGQGCIAKASKHNTHRGEHHQNNSNKMLEDDSRMVCCE